MNDVTRLLPARRGHFLLESGHHGELWLDLELLLVRPEPVRQLTKALAYRVTQHRPDVICGPLVEGAFVALMLAEELGLPFSYAVPHRAVSAGGLFPVRYQIPAVQRPVLQARRVAVVNDVINAGSAARGTLEAIRGHGGEPVALASLAVLGPAARQLAQEHAVALEALETHANTIWTPAECPLCAAGEPLSGPDGA